MFTGFSKSYSRQAMTTTQTVIWVVISVVFLGYMMMWVMKPTDTYYWRWLPDIQEKTSSTFFGEQGANTLIYTFPILFIATLACFYIHIGRKYVSDDGSRWEVKLQDAGLSLGLVGNICLALLFFPVSRGSSILQLVGLTSEASIKYHIWLGHMALTIFIVSGPKKMKQDAAAICSSSSLDNLHFESISFSW